MRVEIRALPVDLFERAERAADRLGRSWSAVYAAALAEYLAAALAGAAAGCALIDGGQWEW